MLSQKSDKPVDAFNEMVRELEQNYDEPEVKLDDLPAKQLNWLRAT